MVSPALLHHLFDMGQRPAEEHGAAAQSQSVRVKRDKIELFVVSILLRWTPAVMQHMLSILHLAIAKMFAKVNSTANLVGMTTNSVERKPAHIHPQMSKLKKTKHQQNQNRENLHTADTPGVHDGRTCRRKTKLTRKNQLVCGLFVCWLVWVFAAAHTELLTKEDGAAHADQEAVHPLQFA